MESVIAKNVGIPPFLIAGRLALLALALCAASFLTSFSDGSINSWIFMTLGLLFAINLALVTWFKINPTSLWLKRFQSVLDVGIVSGIIFCTGGLLSPYLFLYLPVIFLTRITCSLRNSIATSFVAISFYIIASYLNSPDLFSSVSLLKTFIIQIVILAASISLVVISAQYLMLLISKKDAQVSKSLLDLAEQAKGQIQLLEKLPYGVISLNKNMLIKSANKAAAKILGMDPRTLIGKGLLATISEYADSVELNLIKDNGKLKISGIENKHLDYEFLIPNHDSDNHRYFVFQEGLSTSAADNHIISNLEDRLKDLLSNDYADNNLDSSLASRKFIAESLVMKKVFNLIERSANSDATVLIQGESGTGKELAAKALHENSSRAELPFVTVNCGAIPENLMESTLFGHKKGAFTGAISDSVGLIREADGGTLFLDEIGELPLNMQVKLLRVLQERTVRAVGGDRDWEINIRVIAATNRNLKEEVAKGRFREDLYYRLNVINIMLPALRERREDLPVLIHNFIKRISDKDGYSQDVNIASDAMQILLNYNYPGNVRELENILERSLVLGSGSIIAEHLGDLAQTSPTKELHRSLNISETRIFENSDLDLPLDLEKILATVEKKYITLALEKTQGHRTKAAELLGLNLRSFRYRAQKLGL